MLISVATFFNKFACSSRASNTTQSVSPACQVARVVHLLLCYFECYECVFLILCEPRSLKFTVQIGAQVVDGVGEKYNEGKSGPIYAFAPGTRLIKEVTGSCRFGKRNTERIQL